MDSLAQGVLGAGTGSSNVGPTSSTTTLDLVAASAVTPAATNRRLKITARWRSFSVDDTSGVYAFRLQEGATVLADSEVTRALDRTAVGFGGGVCVSVVDSPTAASHTYKLTITRIAGSGTATVQAAAAYLLKIVVEDVGTA